jgi:hypothetical protein
MAEGFSCDYCGEWAAKRRATIWWTFVEVLPDGRERYLPAVYCSPYCGQEASTAAFSSGRG